MDENNSSLEIAKLILDGIKIYSSMEVEMPRTLVKWMIDEINRLQLENDQLRQKNDNS